MLPASVGVEPATSWSPVGRRIQLSHRGQTDTWGYKVAGRSSYTLSLTDIRVYLGSVGQGLLPIVNYFLQFLVGRKYNLT